MTQLIESLKHWGDKAFAKTLEIELMKLGSSNLPLQKAVTPGAFVSDAGVAVTVLSIGDDGINIKAKAGVMFSEILWGYCCGEEEPMINNAYCEISIFINKTTADTKFVVLSG